MATLLAYWPVLHAGFIWDDSGHVTPANLRSLSGLARIWFEPGASQQYYPFLHTAFWIEHRLWGDTAFAYHGLNIMLHATAACLFGVVLRRLVIPGAWLAALLFALHPVGVESVAWISEQKNTLSTVLYLGAALAYFRFATHRSVAGYALATALFLAALLTKTVTASLPAALLVVAWWQRGRLDWKSEVRPLLPWFLLALVAGSITAWVEHNLIGAQGEAFDLSLLQRGLLAGRVVWFYVGKLVWPTGLMFSYPRWEIDPSTATAYLHPMTLLASLALATWFARRGKGPAARAPLAMLLLYVGSLFPALGFVNVYPFIFSYVADHFQYLASLTFFATAGALLTLLGRHIPKSLAWAGGGLLLGILGLASRTQCAIYHDEFSLYQHTLAQNPASWMAHNNLGNVLADAGQPETAITHFTAALRLRPDYPEAANNLGEQLNTLGRFAEAVPVLTTALAQRPDYADAHNNLGNSLVALGRMDEGISHFEQAILARPDHAEAHFNLALALALSGHPAQALPHFARAVQFRPDFPEARLNWGNALLELDRLPEAIAQLELVTSARPALPEGHDAYGRALLLSGRTNAAIDQFEIALQLRPDSAAFHLNLAVALQTAGRDDAAAQHLNEANRLRAQER
ncbi:MAG: tetratricopeptide repeat protein [Cephaloticoccus sp.]|nr:tetratricopeptide repeat protein [Cephaloticoccus sp.]MCF7759452.1 tetratricopeptide repeat protein [Cephaloticoccus sp.]